MVGLMEHPNAVGQVFNVGSTEEVTVQELAQRVIALTGTQSEIRFAPYEQAYGPGFEDMQRRVPALDKIRELIGYTPAYKLDDILTRVIEYERWEMDAHNRLNLPSTVREQGNE